MFIHYEAAVTETLASFTQAMYTNFSERSTVHNPTVG